ncbi:bifunctional folylpolyglutamate synthase/dihydrofolate synthase [Gaiella sp.]|uniref:bifunctional folylpolyglutamate synthase/dihydrofolate synthase n=1 Tax=Gaiella sp. TaxID=2663207 RepID=UPI003982EB85
MSDEIAWLAGLSPWPEDGFGLERMRALLAALGNPQDRYPAVHIVGTNGKSTATLTVERALLAAGLSVGATISPHIRDWSDRLRIDGQPGDLEAALRRVRRDAEKLAATQFETMTAAALWAFADAGVDVAVVEAGLGGRFDATNVLRSRVVLLTNIGLEHTDVLGDTVEAIATEKLAVVHSDDTVVILPDGTFRSLVPQGRIEFGGAREAAAAFVGHPVDLPEPVSLPGRLEWRPGEIRDGAHNPDGVSWLLAHLPEADYTICASILGDKNVELMLSRLATAGSRFVATSSSNARSLAAADLAERARPHFGTVESVGDPSAAVARAHTLGEPVLVTGSLYLLADLEEAARR